MGGAGPELFHQKLTSIFSQTDENDVATISDHPTLKAPQRTVCAGYLGLAKALTVA